MVETGKSAARRAEQRRAAAERARTYRAKKAERGDPSSRDVDAAWSEASAYWIARSGIGGTLHPVSMMRTARLILERRGVAPRQAARAIADRLSSRKEHMEPDHVPSLRPGPAHQFRETERGPWTTPLEDIAEHLAR